jgi:hypothetical protein
MAWTATNPVTIGNATKKSDYDALWDNADYLMSAFDSAGDMAYASAANTIAKLAAGAANLKMFMNAAGTAPEWAKGIYIGTFSRTLTDAGAPTDVAYTGVGFKGSLLRIFGSKSGSFSGTVSGMSDGTKQYCEYQYTDEGIYVSTTYCALASDMAGNQTAVLKSFDSDGFTLTWTKSSSPTGTATFIYIVYR